MPSISELLEIMGRSIAVYIFIIAAIRLFGKNELAQLSVIDLVFILLISNSVQNAMVGKDNSLPGGLTAAIALFLCNYVFKVFLIRSSRFSKLVQGEMIVLVRDGKFLPENLKRARMSDDEVEMAVREHGVKDIKEADLVTLETDGNITVLSEDYSHKSVKRRKKPQLSHNP